MLYVSDLFTSRSFVLSLLFLFSYLNSLSLFSILLYYHTRPVAMVRIKFLPNYIAFASYLCRE